MLYGYDPELARLLSSKLDPQLLAEGQLHDAPEGQGNLMLWARLQGLLLLASAIGLGVILTQI